VSQAAKEKAALEKENYARQISMSRGGSKHGKERPESFDGWNVAGGSAAPRPPPKAGDLSKFGKISSNTSAPMQFGPASVFSAKKEGKKESSLSRTNSSSNMFSMLSSQGGESSESKGMSILRSFHAYCSQ
jgi:translation initiation factor 4G